VHYVVDGTIPDTADVVVLQRVMRPDTPDIIRSLQAAGAVVVYDIDDLYDAIPSYNPASSEIRDPDIALLHESLAAADLVTVSTDELADAYGRFGPVAVLPNYLDPDIWTGNDKYRRLRTDIHVGWLGSARWRGGDLELLRPWLASWLKSHPNVRFVAAGSDESLLGDLGVGGFVCPPARDHVRPYEHLPAMLAWFDIGLVPLTFNRFNESKSWCKGMEYNAAGVPAVASPSREYRKFIEPGVNGYLARDWPSALDRALDNLDTLRAGAKRTAERYVIDRHIRRWVDAYESCYQLARG
jgi:glycosyltransferase involved in cell wall biosynthesis